MEYPVAGGGFTYIMITFGELPAWFTVANLLLEYVLGMAAVRVNTESSLHSSDVMPVHAIRHSRAASAPHCMWPSAADDEHHSCPCTVKLRAVCVAFAPNGLPQLGSMLRCCTGQESPRSVSNRPLKGTPCWWQIARGFSQYIGRLFRPGDAEVEKLFILSDSVDFLAFGLVLLLTVVAACGVRESTFLISGA